MCKIRALHDKSSDKLHAFKMFDLWKLRSVGESLALERKWAYICFESETSNVN